MSDPRRRLEAFFREGLSAAETDGPTSEEMAAYVDGSMEPGDRAAFEALLALDPALRDEVGDLRQLRDALRREASPSRRWAVWTGLAAAASLVGVLVWRGAPPAVEPAAPSPLATPPPILTLRDGGHEVALRADGSIAGLPGLSLEGRADVMSALRGGGLPGPEALARLRGAGDTLMGDASGPAPLHVVAPVGTFVRSERPAFRWTPHPKARGYEVAVFDEAMNKVAAARVAGGVNEITLPSALEPGKTYLWQVAALTRSGRIVAPAPPEPEARFRVLGIAAAAGLDKALAQAGPSDLAAAVLLARAGVRDEAETHLARLAAANPDSADARRLLELARR
jgi:hypothetical protein